CPEDHYGQDYVQRRSCGSGQCDPVTGGCQCPPGQTGARCQHGCPPTKYGPNCELKCTCKNGGLCNPNVFLVIMVWAAILIASVRTVEFATGFLEAVSASQVIMEETANMPTVMQQVDNAFAQQVSTAANVKKSVRLEYLETIAINFVIVKEKAPATQSGQYGPNCSLKCQCVHTAHCDPLNGSCTCPPPPQENGSNLRGIWFRQSSIAKH
ncbi:hypothetical protein E2I00_003068, partial [Balaenoptera physalus]